MEFTRLSIILLLLPFGCGTTSPPTTVIIPPVENWSPVRTSLTSNPVVTGKMAGMLFAHNQVRQSHQLPPLRWSARLAVHAQRWSNHLAVRNACVMQHRPTSGPFERIYGENIFWASPRRWSDGRVQIQPIESRDVVLSWADEEKDYSYARNSCKAGEQCGHYTQLVWRSSTEVGCGMTICPDKGQMWVCSYNPPGNYIGQKPY